MLSVCIPVYEFNIVSITNELKKQLRIAGIASEILLRDDCSDTSYMQQYKIYDNDPVVRVLYNRNNQGRARIRNQLAEDARYQHLLFLDCDASVIHADFIQKYLDCLAANKIIYGGREYKELAPSDDKFQLHWTYGTRKESLSAKKRRLSPYRSFRTNNFVVPKRILQSIPFENQLRGYGYEDNLWAADLQSQGVQIQHIDNQVQHEGLETNERYMQKTEEALVTLSRLYRMNRLPAVKILDKAIPLKNWGLDRILIFFLAGRLARWRTKIIQNGGPISLYQYYRLLYLLRQIRRI